MSKYYELKFTQEMGRGLYVKAGSAFLKGQLVGEFEILLLSPSDTKKVNETELQYYTFKFNDLQDCLVLGDGEIFNHDDEANVKYELVERDGRYMMVFTAIRTIYENEQLFINYAADSAVSVNSYINQKSLLG